MYEKISWSLYVMKAYTIPHRSAEFHVGFRGVVVIICALHAQGPQFNPGRKHKKVSFCQD